ncbi:MAG: hypothetical protein Q4A72_00910 [Bacillota bacterium]|nr:hypothetical protein [Bacillota bacterium]
MSKYDIGIYLLGVPVLVIFHLHVRLGVPNLPITLLLILFLIALSLVFFYFKKKKGLVKKESPFLRTVSFLLFPLTYIPYLYELITLEHITIIYTVFFFFFVGMDIYQNRKK